MSAVVRQRSARRYVLRPASTAISFWVGVIVLALIVAAPLATADWRVFAFVAPPAVLLAWVLWIVLFRPAVHYDESQLVIVNIGRVHTVPWSQVSSLQQGVNLIFHLYGGRRISAWGVPAPKPSGNLVSNFDRRSRIDFNPHRNVEILDGYRVSAAPSDETVTTRWDVVPLLIGGALVIAVVVDFLVAR